jgi:hypothetical protein
LCEAGSGDDSLRSANREGFRFLSDPSRGRPLRVTLAALIGVLFGIFEITNDSSPRALHLALGVVLIALAAAGWIRWVLLPWMRQHRE